METLYIGIGSNLGNSIEICKSTVQRLDSVHGVNTLAVSKWYLTEPFGLKNQPWFVNGAIKLETVLSPYDLLNKCIQIEQLSGRQPSLRWGARILDLDILLWENRIVVSANLKIPHPWLHRRRFVLAPLNDIAPELTHPMFGNTIRSLLMNVPDNLIVKPYENGDKCYETCDCAWHSSA